MYIETCLYSLSFLNSLWPHVDTCLLCQYNFEHNGSLKALHNASITNDHYTLTEQSSLGTVCFNTIHEYTLIKQSF